MQRIKQTNPKKLRNGGSWGTLLGKNHNAFSLVPEGFGIVKDTEIQRKEKYRDSCSQLAGNIGVCEPRESPHSSNTRGNGKKNVKMYLKSRL